MNGGGIIAQILVDHGVRHVFTICGGHISPILTESKKAGIRVVDVRHEATAVYAADAVSRLTGIPGVAAVTAGPGVANCVTPLVNALMAQSPLVLLGGAAATVLRGRGSLQDIDQMSLVRSAVKRAYAVKRNCDLAPVMELAFAFARSGVPGPVFVECPIDLLYDEALVRKWYGVKSGQAGGMSLRDRATAWYLKRHLDRIYACDTDSPEHAIVPSTGPALDRGKAAKAVRIMEKARRPVLVVGSQALVEPGRAPALARAIGALDIPAFLAGMARGLLGGANPLNFHHRRNEALAAADLVVLAGMPCDFRLNYGRAINLGAAIVAVNRSRRDLRLNRAPGLGVVADPGEFLITCASMAGAHPPRGEWMRTLAGNENARRDEIRAFSEENTGLVNPLRLAEMVDDALADESVIVADGGDFVASASYIVRPRGPLSWLDPGVFGTLGVGAGFALGAGLCRPGADVWLLWGDGAAGYGLSELDTFVRHGIPVIAVVGNDACWTQIARDQVEILGDDVATVLRHSDYHVAAEGLGARGLLVRSEGELGPALRRAVDLARAGAPVLVNALIGKSDFRKGSVSM